MDRRAVSRGVVRLSPFIALVAVLGLLAGVLPALVTQPSGSSRHGLATQAPGSSGSVSSHPVVGPARLVRRQWRHAGCARDRGLEAARGPSAGARGGAGRA
jgi:hypothetical protein